jgi:hypothetical protein
MTNQISTFLHQIFYQHKKFDTPASCRELEAWMLVDQYRSFVEEPGIVDVQEDVLQIDQEPSYPQTVRPVTTLPKAVITLPKADFFLPKKEDTLFWCAYVLHHGEGEYRMIGNRYRNVEIQEKQRILDYIRANTAEFKTSGSGNGPKITNVSIQEVQSELMINKKTSWITFWMMCVFYRFHALVVYDKTYLECNPRCSDPSPPIYHFTRSKDGHISLHMTPLTEEEAEVIRTSHVRVDMLRTEHPLRAMSNYKVPELETMANLLGLPDKGPVKIKKADLYEAIVEKCRW